MPHGSAQLRTHLASIPPGLYRSGEPFDKVYEPALTGAVPIGGLVWRRFVTVHQDRNAVVPLAVAGVAREVLLAEPALLCATGTSCPVTGAWQPWLSSGHPAATALNQPWRQAWVAAGQLFPNPWHGEQPPFNPAEVTWHLIEAGTSAHG